MEKNIKELKILYSKEELETQIKLLANKINQCYKSDDELILICVLRGAVMFYTELAKYLKMPIRMEFVSISSYGNEETSTYNIKSQNINLKNIENKNVLIVEDIIDSGYTLKYLKEYLIAKYNVKKIEIAVMLNKKCARKFDIEPDYYAFTIDNKFVVGYGLDYQNLYRNLDYIGYFE